MAERGLSLAHTTIMRWVQRYVPEFDKRWNRFARRVGGSWAAIVIAGVQLVHRIRKGQFALSKIWSGWDNRARNMACGARGLIPTNVGPHRTASGKKLHRNPSAKPILSSASPWQDYDALFIEQLDLLLKLRDEIHVTWKGHFRPPLTGQGVTALNAAASRSTRAERLESERRGELSHPRHPSA